MSELKAFRIIQGDTGGYGAPSYKCDTDGNRLEEWGDICEVYDKFDADKVIAEKDTEIAELKESIKNLILDNYLKDKELYRHKYRRCLDMAYKCVVLCQKSKDLYRWAEDENLEHYYNHKIEFFARWHNRWLELAEKFKEVK